VSSQDVVDLTSLEQDALTELVNLGVGRAATGLRSMVGSEIRLSVPSVAFVSRTTAAELISANESGKLVAVQQLFEGALSGRALLIFPETNSLELVRAVTGGGLPLEDIIGLEPEALAETGNVILNGCLGVIANMLHQTLRISLPEILHGSSVDIFDTDGAPDVEGGVLFLYINFSVERHDIRGYIAMLMDMPSLFALKTLLGELIARIEGYKGDHARG
jgi:chemotaxis protein CheC